MIDAPNNDSPDAAFKRLASQLHPDHGGTTDAMRDLNALHDQVKEARKFKFNHETARPQADVNYEGPDGASPFSSVATDDENFDTDETPFSLDGVLFPRQASARIRSFSPEEFEQWKADRIRAKTDPMYLAEILEFDMCETPHRVLFDQLIPMQYPAPDISQLKSRTGKKKMMILWPRGLFKTSAAIMAIIQIFLSYPNGRVLFLTSTDDLAKQQLGRIVAHFEIGAKPRFKYLFPEYCLTSRQNRKTKEWEDHADALGNAHAFTLPCRTNMTFAEASFTLSTPKSAKTGSHYDFIFIDDLVNENTVDNDAMLEKSHRQYTRIVPLLEPTGLIVMTGTRYHYSDAYQKIQDQATAAGEFSVWQFSIKDCWSSNCLNCGCAQLYHDFDVNILEPPCMKCGPKCIGWKSDGSTGVLFPVTPARNGRQVGHSLAGLQAIKAEIGDEEFANQYENKPMSAKSQTFTETMIGAQTIHDRLGLPGYSAFSFVIGDLADSEDSEKSERDQSVLMLCRKQYGCIYIIEARFGRWGSSELVDNIIFLLRDPNMRPNKIWLEKTLGTGHLLNLVKARTTQMNLPDAPIELLKMGNKKGAKHRRILNLQEGLVSKRVFVYGGMNGYQELVNQLVKYPRIKHDDLADTAGMALECPTNYQTETPPAPQSTQAFLKKLLGPPPDPYANDGHNDGTSVCGAGI